MRRFLGFLTSIFLVFLTACGSVTPPQEFAPLEKSSKKPFYYNFVTHPIALVNL
jgi:ABC-type oligopeptide transport system substrate-binding subunit